MLINKTKLQTNIDCYWRLAIFGFLAVLFIATPGISHANPSFCTVLSNILALIQGTPAKVIATLAIVFLGISAFFGKLNWGTALLVGVGIAAIFGAAAIVSAVAGNPAEGAC